jgi:hypothetical protein
LKLKEEESDNDHIKTMSEIFEVLAVIGDPVGEEDRVMHLLTSLSDMLVTALESEAQSEMCRSGSRSLNDKYTNS